MNSTEIPYVSICSGIEAFSVAVHDMPEFIPVAFSEIEDFPSRVLAHHWPDVPNLGDFTAIDVTAMAHVGWLVGGTPCQSFSVAGLRKGLADDRGNLTLEYVRLAHALQENNGLRGALWENVPGCLSDKTNAFGCFLGAIVGHDGPLYPGDKPRYGRSTDTWRWVKPGREPVIDDDGEETGEFEDVGDGYHRPKWPDAGMVAGPRARAAWRVLDSQHFGVPQRRRRVFVVIDFGNGADPAAVLFEPRGQVGGAEQGGTAGEEVAGEVAPSLVASGRGVERTGDSRGQDPLIVSEYSGNAEGGNAEGGNQDVPSLNASNGKKGINNQTGLVMVFDPNQITSKTNRSQPEPGMSHTLPATSSPPVMFTSDVMSFGSKGSGLDAAEDIAPTLRASGHADSHANGGSPPAIVFNAKAGGNKTIGKSYIEDGTTYTLDTDGSSSAIAIAMRGRDDGAELEMGTNQANALRSADGGSSKPMVMPAQVRRLLPVECEKLQGYPRNHTLIPGLSGWRDVGDDEDVAELEAMGLTIRRTAKSNKLRVNDPDGPRYKALGNSFTVEVVNWIMSRVRASLAGEPMPDWQPLRLWAKPRS